MKPTIKIYVEGGCVTGVDLAGVDADYEIIDYDNLDDDDELNNSGHQIRHDMLGWYICSDAEAAHEDAGSPSVGFDGREHWNTFNSAREALLHPKIKHGLCSVCGHYGDDCTGQV